MNPIAAGTDAFAGQEIVRFACSAPPFAFAEVVQLLAQSRIAIGTRLVLEAGSIPFQQPAGYPLGDAERRNRVRSGRKATPVSPDACLLFCQVLFERIDLQDRKSTRLN